MTEDLQWQRLESAHPPQTPDTDPEPSVGAHLPSWVWLGSPLWCPVPPPSPAVDKHCPLHSTPRPHLPSHLRLTSTANSHSQCTFTSNATSPPHPGIPSTSTQTPARLPLPHTPRSPPITTRHWTGDPRPSPPGSLTDFPLSTPSTPHPQGPRSHPAPSISPVMFPREDRNAVLFLCGCLPPLSQTRAPEDSEDLILCLLSQVGLREGRETETPAPRVQEMRRDTRDCRETGWSWRTH